MTDFEEIKRVMDNGTQITAKYDIYDKNGQICEVRRIVFPINLRGFKADIAKKYGEGSYFKLEQVNQIGFDNLSINDLNRIGKALNNLSYKVHGVLSQKIFDDLLGIPMVYVNYTDPKQRKINVNRLVKSLKEPETKDNTDIFYFVLHTRTTKAYAERVKVNKGLIELAK